MVALGLPEAEAGQAYYKKDNPRRQGNEAQNARADQHSENHAANAARLGSVPRPEATPPVSAG
jgi:hypothetical protein